MRRRLSAKIHAKSPGPARSTTGQTFVELAFGILFVTAMTLFCLDIGILMMAYSVNDRACRDAARAASLGANQQDAENRAKAMLTIYQRSSNWVVTNPSLIDNGVVYMPAAQPGPNAGPPVPIVSVTTKMQVKIPAPVLLGATMGDNGQVEMKKKYTFPVIGVAPPAN